MPIYQGHFGKVYSYAKGPVVDYTPTEGGYSLYRNHVPCRVHELSSEEKVNSGLIGPYRTKCVFFALNAIDQLLEDWLFLWEKDETLWRIKSVDYVDMPKGHWRIDCIEELTGSVVLP